MPSTAGISARHDHYAKAAKLDTNYIAPVVRAVYTYINMRK